MAASSSSASSAAPDVEVVPAVAGDLPALFALVNEAYQVETGDSGVAFKCTNRLLDADAELLPSIAAGRALKALVGGALAGCICFEEQQAAAAAVAVHDGGADAAAAPHMHFGPFAVAASAQGRGVGRALLEALYARARARGIRYVDIEVVNWRTDVMPWYERMGYVRFGTGDFPAPERLARPASFVLMRLDLQKAPATEAM
jgi:GNAT superfamily N-acetyltransferase